MAAVIAIPASAPAATSTLQTGIVTDPLTGVALDGYDPVTYFTDATPKRGLPDFAINWQGVTWYFASAANRDIFIRHPDVYAPQFGGHGAMGIVRGYLSDGNPQVYLIVSNRLYLFYSPANRDAFEMSGPRAIASARTRWAGLSAQLIGHR